MYFFNDGRVRWRANNDARVCKRERRRGGGGRSDLCNCVVVVSLPRPTSRCKVSSTHAEKSMFNYQFRYSFICTMIGYTFFALSLI